MSVDWTKPIQTRDGRKAEFVRVLQSHNEYTHACIIQIHGREELVSYRESGRVLSTPGQDHPGDIVNVPEEVVLSVFNVYDQGCSKHPSRHSADIWRDGNCTHVITIIRCGQEVKTLIEKVS